MSILIAKNNLHQNCLRTSTKKKKKLSLLQSQTNPNYSSKNPQNRSCDRLVQIVCSRYGPSLRQKLTTNFHQPNLTSANYSNLFSFTLLLSLSLLLSIFEITISAHYPTKPMPIYWNALRAPGRSIITKKGDGSQVKESTDSSTTIEDDDVKGRTTQKSSVTSREKKRKSSLLASPSFSCVLPPVHNTPSPKL